MSELRAYYPIVSILPGAALRCVQGSVHLLRTPCLTMVNALCRCCGHALKKINSHSKAGIIYILSIHSKFLQNILHLHNLHFVNDKVGCPRLGHTTLMFIESRFGQLTLPAFHVSLKSPSKLCHLV